MLNDYKLEIFIKNSVEVITKILNLPPIKIIIDKYYPNCSYCYSNRSYKKPLLIFGLNDFKTRKDKRIRFMNFSNKIYFITAHEVAHYLQHYKFPKWFKKYDTEARNFYNTNKDYQNSKIEKNASKIAKVLLKEYKKRNENVRKIKKNICIL